jgi:cation diffusion facilitator family transporter
MDGESRKRRSLLAVDLGLAANAVLAALKTGIGVVGNSPALLADGINSVSDVVYYVVVRVFMVLARKPADDDHPYGHERLESIGALVVGSFVIATGLAVLLSASHRTWELLAGAATSSGASSWALWAALLTIAVKLVLTAVTRRLSRLTGNPAVAALAYDHRNDVLSASAATLGILLGRTGHAWVDPAAGAAVALVILRTGVEILRESATDLMGTQPGRELAGRLREWIGSVRGVLQVEDVRAHCFGPYLVLNVTIGVDGAISVAAGDRIADEVEALLAGKIEFLRGVHVHYHPVGAHGASATPGSLAAPPSGERRRVVPLP